MQHAQRLNGESWRRTARNTFVTRLASVIAALGVIAVCAPSAYARQVAEAHWTTHGWWWSPSCGISFPQGLVAVGETLSVAEGCHDVFLEASLSHSSSSLDFHAASNLGGNAWFVDCVAGAEAVMLVRTSGSLWMSVGGQLFEKGDTVMLQAGESVTFNVGAEGDAQVLIVGGSLALVVSDGWVYLGESGGSCPCEWDWPSGGGCGEGADPSPPCISGGGDGVWASVTATAITAEVQGISSKMVVSAFAGCYFLLTSDCCVEYVSCSDGSCGGQLLYLQAGWHGVGISTQSYHSSSMQLYFTQCDGGLDCNNNGLNDRFEIFQAEWQGVYLDSDYDTQLDSCERAAGDLNLDGSVGSADLAILLDDWWSGGNSNDINGDGVVNGFDLTTLLYFWGE